jgi:hypothetical protein
MTNLPDPGVAVYREKFNPRNIEHMPAVKFFARLDLEQILLFLDGNERAQVSLNIFFRTAESAATVKGF